VKKWLKHCWIRILLDNNINEEIIPVVKHNLGPSKKNLLPLPPLTKEQPLPKKEVPIPEAKVSPKHDNNKAALIIVDAATAWFLFR